MSKILKEFKIYAKSKNTNSFGLYQFIAVAKDGESYKIHGSYIVGREEGDSVMQHILLNDKGEATLKYFLGYELTSKINNAPKEIIDELFLKQYKC